MLPAGLEPTIPASEGPQTHALERAATGIGTSVFGIESNVVTLQAYHNATRQALSRSQQYRLVYSAKS